MPSGSSDLWADPPPTPKDPDAFLFMGADPAWTPAREYGNPKVDPDHARGEPCILCHGDGAEVVLPSGLIAILEGEVPEGSHRVCGRCMKYGLDHRLGEALIVADPDQPVESDRPGYVVKEFANGCTVEAPEKNARQLKG